MAQFKNKEEYEKWKADRENELKTKQATTGKTTVSPEKKCPYCFSDIHIKASICPSCKKRIGNAARDGVARKHYSVVALLLLILVGLVFFGLIVSLFNTPRRSESLSANSAVVHKFTVIGREGSALSILIPRGKTKEQLKAMLFEVRKARQTNTLHEFIPATTPKGSSGPYAIVWLFFLEDFEWASGDRLTQFIKSSNKNPTDRAFSAEYAQHIKAEYFYGINSSEYGNLGYNDGIDQNSEYEKLF